MIFRTETSVRTGNPSSNLHLGSDALAFLNQLLSLGRQMVTFELMDVIWILLFGAIYFLCADFSIVFQASEASIANVWIPAGLSLAVLLRYGINKWPGILLGSLFANLGVRHSPLSVVLLLCFANLVESLLSVFLLSHRKLFMLSFKHFSDFVAFLLSVVFSSAIAALIAGIGLIALGRNQFSDLYGILLTWWTADCLSMVTLTPILLTLLRPRFREELLRSLFSQKSLLIITATLIFSWIVFSQNVERSLLGYPYNLFPFFVWVALKLGLTGVFLCNLLTTAIGLQRTIAGFGFFGGASPEVSLVSLQLFLLILQNISIVLAAIFDERRKAEAVVKSINQDLENRVEERTRDLEKALKDRDDFFSIASHELKTPLAGLQLQTQLAKKGLARAPNDPVESARWTRFLNQSEVQLKKLTRLVNEMLDLTKVRQGRLPLKKEEFAFDVLVREVLERFTLEKSNVVINLEVSGGPLTGTWDRFRMEQVLSNLITNSIRYGNNTPISIRLLGDKGHLKLVVSDKGPGIAPEDHQRIFSAYERLSPNDSTSGLGIGLYISRQIIEQHGGTIFVDSELGSGATFVVHLPTRHTIDSEQMS